MRRGLLSDEELRQIEQQLPDTTEVATVVYEYRPDSVAMQVGSMNTSLGIVSSSEPIRGGCGCRRPR